MRKFACLSPADKSGVKAAFGLYNNHARANAAANAVMLSQELGVKLKGMPNEAMVSKFPEIVQKPAVSGVREVADMKRHRRCAFAMSHATTS